MLLKRLYDHSDPANLKVCGVRVLHAGKKQKFSPDLLSKGAMEGWLSMADGKITLKGEKETLVYRIVRTPGYYCCHCKAAVHDQNDAKLHIAAKHQGAASPDPENPSGYMKTNAYKGVREV